MGLIYITGISGAGKSTIGKTLSEHGYETYDVDEDGFAAHYSKATGEKAKGIIRTKQWHDRHEWKISRPMVERLAAQAKDKTIFLCGVAANDNTVWDLFTQVFALCVDEKTLRKRLANRQNNEFGKNKDELQIVLDWQVYAKDQYIDLGATIIDATKPIDKIVAEILRQIND